MTLLPLDLLPQILNSLDATNLENCCLVSSIFHKVSQQLLFSDLVLCEKTWQAKTMFLLSETGEPFCACVKKITLKLSAVLALVDSYNIPTSAPEPLLRLLGTLGSHVETLQIEGLLLVGTDGDPFPPTWKALPCDFRTCLVSSVLPNIRWLRLRDISSLPLFTIMTACPLLEFFDMGAIYSDLTIRNDNSTLMITHLPIVQELSLGPFSVEDFEGGTALFEYLKVAGNKISTLKLSRFYLGHTYFPLDLKFLRPLEGLCSHLRQLCLGSDVFCKVVKVGTEEIDEYAEILALSSFPRLQFLSFDLPPTFSRIEWTQWMRWLERVIISGSQTRQPLQTLRFLLPINSVIPEPSLAYFQQSNLDQVGQNLKIEIHVVVPSQFPVGMFQPMFHFFSTCFQLLNQGGNLKFMSSRL
ncbi:hypothetical protein DL96DRAFT_1010406 [Flagelloscypha sp. PMI_526]|nr:hypothetical protein DL96DRAFT_1010406 [Flagelloscypha sp. PMI_526]